MKIIAILLIILGILKVIGSLREDKDPIYEDTIKNMDIPDFINVDFIIWIGRFLSGMNGIIELMGGMFILHVL